MLEYQKRVVDEKDELDMKIEALQKFITSSGVNVVDFREQERLLLQLGAMTEYSTILGRMIIAFPAEG